MIHKLSIRSMITALVIITSVVVAVVVGTSDSSASATAPKRLPANCRAMLPIPAYSFKVNATDMVHVQSGKRLVQAAVKSSQGSTHDLKIQCRQLVINYAADLIFQEEHKIK